MKNVKLNALAAACLGAVASTSVMAFEPQDYGTSTLVGENEINLHNAWGVNNTVCGALCTLFSTESGGVQEVHRIPDQMPGASETLNCTIADASGNLIAGFGGNTPQIVLSYSYNDDFGGVPGNDVSFDNLNGPAAPAFGNTVDMTECALETDELGKISGGWMKTFSELAAQPGTFIHTFRDFETRTFNVAQCPTGVVPTIADSRAIDGPAIQSGDLSTVPPGCNSVDSAFDYLYLTCDTQQSCGSGGKAVPMPAFAAAALGLGLVGLTYMSSSRRRVKS